MSAKNKSSVTSTEERKPQPSLTNLLALEQRFLLDAAAVSTANEVLSRDIAAAQSEVAIDQFYAPANFSGDVFSSNDLEYINSLVDTDFQNTKTEIVFIDRAVSNIPELLAGINPNADIYFLDTDEDGVDQIANILSNYDNVDALHILSHGDQGTVFLGNATLNADSMRNNYGDLLATIGNSLTAEGDILIYGCDFTGGQDGLAAATILGNLTGADIAASNDDTGAAALGGNWILETQIGNVETLSIAATSWNGLLAISGPLTVDDQANAGSTINLTVVSGNAGAAGVTTSDIPEGSLEAVDVIWRYNETGDAGTTTISFDLTQISGESTTEYSDLTLIIADNQDLDNASTNVKFLTASSFDGNTAVFRLVDLNDGDFLTLSTLSEANNFSAPDVSSTNEDNVAPLNITLSSAVTMGGDIQSIFATSIGYRSDTAGTTPTIVDIPAGATGIQITAFSTRPNDQAGVNNLFNDDYQTLNVTVDLANQTTDGFLAYIVDRLNGNSGASDQYGWIDAPLGQDILNGGGQINGNFDDGINPIFSIIDGQLHITENHDLQTAYHIEFLTSNDQSAVFLGTVSDVLNPAVVNNAGTIVTPGETSTTLNVSGDADYVVLSESSASAGENFRQEYKGFSRIVVDFESMTASGTIAVEVGETDGRVITFAFEDYDVSSAGIGAISAATSTIIGDFTATELSVLNLPQIFVTGDAASGFNINITRNTDYANAFTSLYTAEIYDRIDAGSIASFVSNEVQSTLFDADTGTPSSLNFSIPDSATVGIIRLSMDTIGGNTENENVGSAFLIIDLENGISSGSFVNIRAATPDLVSWSDIPIGDIFFSHLNDSDTSTASSNRNNISQFVDQWGATAKIEIVEVNGVETLVFSASSENGRNTQNFRDYFTTAQVQWLGREPLRIGGVPQLGTLTAGTRLPNGDYEVDINDIPSLGFLPPPDFSGDVPINIQLSLFTEVENINVNVAPIADGLSLTNVPDASGDEDTDIDISAPATLPLSDTDGSETITSYVIGSIPVGHTISDGVNSFTATSGTNSIDIFGWDRDSLIYRAPMDFNGVVSLTIAADVDDVAGAQVDTITSNTSFNVTINPTQDDPVAVNDGPVAVIEDIASVGNVLTDPGGVDNDVDGDTLSVTSFSVSGVSGLFSAGQVATIPGVGSLTIAANGIYTFTPLMDYNGPVPTATYTISDGNGGSDSANLSFADVTPTDDAISITDLTDGAVAATDGSVEESDLVTGTTSTDTDDLLNGAFTISIVDGVQNIIVNGTTITQSALINSDMVPVNVMTANGSIAINGFDPLTGNVSYTYTLGNSVDHMSGAVTESISLVMTDADGDTAIGTLAIAILDDTPVANADTDEAINEAGNPSSTATGNVVTGIDSTDPNTSDGIADMIGADTIAMNPVTGVAVGTGTPTLANVGATITGTFGDLILNADGSYTYTPDFTNLTVQNLSPNTVISDVFTYEIIDGDGDTTTTTLTINIVGTPAIVGLGDGSVAGSDGMVLESDLTGGSNAAGSGETVTGSFQALAPNGVDEISVGGTTITEVQLLTSATTPIVVSTPLGDLTINGYNQMSGVVDYTYTLDTISNHNGNPLSDDIAITITDGNSDRGGATLSIAVIDDAPIATNDTNAITEDDTLPATGNVITSNDVIGADDMAMPITAVGAGTGMPSGGVNSAVDGTYGALTLNADGNYSYVIDNASPVVQALAAGEVVTDIFTYEVTDSDGSTTTATLTISVTGLNDAPVADPEVVTTPEETPITIDILDGDTDIDGTIDPASVMLIDPATGMPAASVTITNQGTYTVDTNAASSTFGQVTFTPIMDFFGAVTPITYQISDDQGAVSTSTISVMVTNINDDPVAIDDGPVAVTEDIPVMGNVLTDAGGLDSDADGDTLTVVEFTIDGQTINVDPMTGGTVILSGIGDLTINADGSYIFTPALNYNGPIPTATYVISDGNGGMDTATLSFTDITPVNDAPVANPNTITIDEEMPASGNILTDTVGADTDVDGDTLTVTGATVDIDGDGTADILSLGTLTQLTNMSGDSIGMLTVNDDGSFTFTPAMDYDGLVPIITYTISDSNGGTSSSTLEILITPLNDVPVLSGIPVAPQTNLDSDTGISLSTASAFLDPDGDILNYSATGLPPGLMINPATGEITGDIDSSASQSSPYTVMVTATDPSGTMVTVSFNWTVTNPNPMANDDGTIIVTEDIAQNFDPRSNDVDPDGDTITITSIDGTSIAVGMPVSLTSGAIVTLNPNGTLTFNPAANQNGLDSFTYEITDADGAMSIATVMLDIGGVNDAPTAPGSLLDLSNVDDETIVNIATASEFTDIDGDTLTYSAAGLPPGLTINPSTGEITGTIDPSASQGGPLGNGIYTYTVTASDPNGQSVDLSATWSVTNPGPVSGTIPDETITDGGSVSIDTTVGFTDPDGDTLTYAATGLPSYLSIDPMTGEISGTAPIDASSNGPVSVTVTVDDGEGGTASETFLITPQNPAPVVTSTPDQTNNDGQNISLDISNAFNDPDGDVLTFTGTGLPPGLSIDPVTGLITGTLTNSASQLGPYTVSITATDADGATATDTFVWNVVNPAPTVINQIPNQAANDSDTFNLDVSPFFGDGDADGLTFSAIGLPPGLTIDPATGEISGTLPADASLGQPYVVSVTVDDGEGGMATDTFAFTINNLNPGLVSQIHNQDNIDGEMITPVDISSNFIDPDMDPLTFTASGLPPGLSIDPNTGVISGTLTQDASQNGPYSVTITASDGTNEIVDAFTWNVANPVPVVTTSIPDQLHTDGDNISFPIAGFFEDPDADGLSYSASGLPPGLFIDSTTGEISGTLTSDASATSPFSVTLMTTDSDGDSVTTAFTWNVENIPPVAVVEPADLSNQDSDPVSLPTAGFFEDSDNDPIVYTATGLPPGLSIDPMTGVITGTIDPSASVNGPYTPIIVATDNAGDSASVTFEWTIDNIPPIATDDMAQTPEDTPILLTPLANDNSPDGDMLIISQINGMSVAPGDLVTLPDGGLVVINADNTITYTPAPDSNGVESFSYTVNDGEGGESTATITITVEPVEDAPRLTGLILDDQVNDEADEVSINVSNAFTDPDGDGLTFTATGLPPGLSIDPLTGIISGEPATGSAADGPYSITIIATDSNGNLVTLEFTWIINSAGANIQALLDFGAANSPGVNFGPGDAQPTQTPFGGVQAGGIVRTAVNAVDDLNGIGTQTALIDTFRILLNRIDDRFGTNYSADGFKGAEGFSSSVDVANTSNLNETGQTGQFMIDTFVRDRVLFVHAFDTIAGRGFKEFRATLGDGRALPGWISSSPDGLLLIERPTNVETVTLKITGIREGGGTMTRYVAIDTLTGEIRTASAGQAYGPSFSTSVEKIISNMNKHDHDVEKIMERTG